MSFARKFRKSGVLRETWIACCVSWNTRKNSGKFPPTLAQVERHTKQTRCPTGDCFDVPLSFHDLAKGQGGINLMCSAELGDVSKGAHGYKSLRPDRIPLSLLCAVCETFERGLLPGVGWQGCISKSVWGVDKGFCKN